MSFSVIKDCGDIWNRLFDHRPFLSGEIKYFIKEFEENRSDREVKRLFDVADWLSDIKESQIPKASSSLPELNKINTLLGIALQTSNTILENEENFNVDTSLQARRAFRKSEWESFNNDLKEKYSKIDHTFTEKEEDLINFYQDLEKKLYI